MVIRNYEMEFCPFLFTFDGPVFSMLKEIKKKVAPKLLSFPFRELEKLLTWLTITSNSGSFHSVRNL